MIRLFDILFALSFLLLCSPIFLVVILINRFTGEGEVFYRQQRIGENGAPFYILKFATMLKNSPNMGAGTFVEENDPRVLPFGKFLRKSKINELPQVLNVLKGDMSFVGFRPLIKKSYDKAVEIGGADVYAQKPGITSLAAIAYRNEEELLKTQDDKLAYYYGEILPHKVALDRWWKDHATLGTYLKAIVATAYAVFLPHAPSPLTWFKKLPDGDKTAAI